MIDRVSYRELFNSLQGWWYGTNGTLKPDVKVAEEPTNSQAKVNVGSK
jgi:hypothetical protein